VWQRIYEELNDPNFVIICVAEDTGGEAVAGPIFDAANPTYIQVVDENHIISSAFNFINVPSAAWIDETGRIVRIDEGTYARSHELGVGDQKVQFGTDAYAPAVKDWAAKGAASEYVQSAAAVTGNIRKFSVDEQKADAAFRLANLFRSHGQSDKAEHYWNMAQTLNPDSINFFRQNLTLSEEGSAGATFLKMRGEYEAQGKDYYRPLDLDQ
jgi:hypothetical protein